ncbi:MAG: PfkB family carbohydrate kinase [Armatimonadota bacterium]|nr:PfkB family carbohydrate kinase [Armatimonadota bacterium]MCX7778077.1 PfkB family carbohydrate kinase [Armatimonadota bacterium]MDW8025756.1 PfkB family carbohydrate kinase [Armatimonadota bacterium]
MMSRERLAWILEKFDDVSVVVLGDFFLDKYLIIDPSLSEVSLETGLTAHQVVRKRRSPGAAGTICNNLASLGVGRIYALTVIGDDGEGYELTRELKRRGVITNYIIVDEERFTPTYTKPMMLQGGREIEMERQDIKNREPMKPELEHKVIEVLSRLLSEVDAVIVQDQVQERNCGVVTDRVRGFVCKLAEDNPNKIFYADSRARIGEFKNVMVKPNRYEAAMAIGRSWVEGMSIHDAVEFGKLLYGRIGRTVFLTMGEWGILVVEGERVTHIPAVPVSGEIDIVGAGDSVTAGIVPSLCAGASCLEAAFIGNLVASVTIKQIGTTGTATREQVLHNFERYYEAGLRGVDGSEPA